MAFDLSSIAGEIFTPENVGTALQYFGSQMEQEGNTDASNAYTRAMQEAVDKLLKGYDSSLGYTEEGADALRRIADAGVTDVSNLYRQAGSTYQDDLERALSTYRGIVAPGVDQYGNAIIDASSQYGSDIMTGAGAAGDVFDAGGADVERLLSPYMETGQQSLQYLASILGQDPSQLDPSQQRVADQYKRSALQRLAASGLRGSGRGGISTVNSGEAELAAQMFQQNRDRQDRAAEVLGQQGYSATGSVAQNKQNLANTKGNMLYYTVAKAAGQNLAASTDAAKTALNANTALADKSFGTLDKAGQVGYNTTRDVGNQVGSYYNRIGDIESGRFGSRADTALNKAATEAAGVTSVGQQNFSNDSANNKLTAQAIGSVTSALLNAGKDKAMGTPADPKKGSSNSNTDR